MKKIVLMLLSAVAVNQAWSQCACCGSVSGFSGGESTPGAASLRRGAWLTEMYVDHRTFRGISTVRDPELGVSTTTALVVHTMDIGLLGIRYGLTDKAVLLIQQPVFLIRTPSLNSKTTGDLMSLINYNLANNPNVVIDAQVGIEWPTGQVVQFANGSSVSTGSGSFDPVVGLSAKRSFKRSFVRANTFFKNTTKGYNDTYFGNFLGQQLNYTFFLSRSNNFCTRDSLKEKPLVSLITQVSSEWSQQQMKQHGYIENTGSFLVLGTMGIALSYKGFTVPLSISVPMYQKYNGQQNVTSVRIRAGITKTFN
jgi:hypothetical protein